MADQLRRHRDHPVGNDESGFTLMEVLVVLIVLGILAAVVVFALTGTSNQSVTAACDANARTVSVAASAYMEENPFTGQLTQAQLTATGTGTLPSWPSDSTSSYSIMIAGDAGAPGAGQLDTFGHVIAQNDILVKIGANYYDASASLDGACQAA